MEITCNASSPSKPRPTPGNFTGGVRVDDAAMHDAPSRVSLAMTRIGPKPTRPINPAKEFRMKTGFAAALVATLGIGTALAQQPSPGNEAGIVRAASRPATPGSPDFFTGSVTVRPVVDPMAPGRTALGMVVFQPGARSNWHTHPAGQMIHVVEGCGWTQRESGPVVRICKGDTAFVPAGVRHWHGAAADSAMVQLAVTETIDGRNVDWMEPVTLEQYRIAPGNPG